MMNFSPIIIGTMRWGSWGADHSKKEVQHLIGTAMQESIYTFDHADIYGDYTTEKLFGDAFSEMNLNREEVQFISKCGIELPGANNKFTVKAYNYSKEYILKSVAQSLLNLKTDYLDLLLLHRPSPLMDPDEIAESFHILKDEGKVLQFGVSNFSHSQFNLMNNVFPLVTNQIEFSLNKPEVLYDGTIDQLFQKNLKPMAYSVMGNYFTEKSPENNRIKLVLKDLCENYNAEENQILLAFILNHPAKIIPIIGISNAKTIKELKKSLTLLLDRVDWFRLLEAAHGKEVK